MRKQQNRIFHASKNAETLLSKPLSEEFFFYDNSVGDWYLRFCDWWLVLVFWDCQFWIADDCLMTNFQFLIIRSGVRTFANAASHSRCIFLQKYFTFLCKNISHFYAKIVHICFKNISHFSPKVIQIFFKSIFRFSPKTNIMLSPKILEKKWNNLLKPQTSAVIRCHCFFLRARASACRSHRPERSEVTVAKVRGAAARPYRPVHPGGMRG